MDISKKIMPSIIKLVMGIINILIVMPLALSLVFVVISLYLLDVALLIMPVALVLNLIMPQLPISFGTELLWVKILVSFASVGMGYYFYKLLRKYSIRFLEWLWIYMKKSITFTLLDKYIVSS